MRVIRSLTILTMYAAMVACAPKAPAATDTAVTAAAPAAPNVTADLWKDAEGVQKKLVDLAKAMPETSMNWRPMPGVRSVREVFLHVASDNYLLPAMMGTAAPAATGIVATDMKTLEAYEKRDLKKDAVVADLETSFAHLKQVMSAEDASKSASEVDFFGTKLSRQQAWIGTTTHLHEHLGQAIAYARSNKIVPPWSK